MSTNTLLGYHRLARQPRVVSHAAVVGPKEGAGPLGDGFDVVLQDDTTGAKSFELAEVNMVGRAANLTLERIGLSEEAVSFYIGGDLLNQIIVASFTARQLQIPFLGIYGACSTMAQSMALGAMLLSGGFGTHVLCTASSHFSTAERQYRFPLEHGNQRPPAAQWTVTGVGAVVLSLDPVMTGPVVQDVTVGTVQDKHITDVNNMGAAMAPAAADTLIRHFAASGRTPEYYDLIVTGDLGLVGRELLWQLMDIQGFDIRQRHFDCGCEIYKGDPNVHAGGSGCGCSGSVLCGHLLPRLERGELRRVLFMATGALLSPTSAQQGESIPGIAHAITLCAREESL